MGILDRLRKKTQNQAVEAASNPSPLKRLCENDARLYEDLGNIRLRPPSETYEQLCQNAVLQDSWKDSTVALTPDTKTRLAGAYYDLLVRALHDNIEDGVDVAAKRLLALNGSYRRIAEDPRKALDVWQAYMKESDLRKD